MPHIYSIKAQVAMRFNSVGFALSVGMALIVVLFGFTLLSAAGLAGFAADDASVEQSRVNMYPKGEGLIVERVEIKASNPVWTAVEAAEIATGDALFKGNCAQCHAINEQVVGPALGGITKRRPMSWLLPWVKNSSKMVASGDEYAVNLFNKYNKQQMPSFALEDQQIKSIVAYIISQEASMPTVGAIALR